MTGPIPTAGVCSSQPLLLRSRTIGDVGSVNVCRWRPTRIHAATLDSAFPTLGTIHTPLDIQLSSSGFEADAEIVVHRNSAFRSSCAAVQQDPGQSFQLHSRV